MNDMQPTTDKLQRRRLQGVIVSARMSKTVVVKVDRVKMHPKYHKQYVASTKVKAHDEKGEYKVGEEVVIEETRPISRDKHWRVVAKV